MISILRGAAALLKAVAIWQATALSLPVRTAREPFPTAGQSLPVPAATRTGHHEAFARLEDQNSLGKYNRYISTRQNSWKNSRLDEHGSMHRELGNYSTGPGMCIWSWQSTHSVIRFSSESSPE